MGSILTVIKNRTVLEIVVFAWIVIAVCYLMHTPVGVRSHDFTGHLEYTKIIVNQHRLPFPNEGWQTYHPPLYYLIDSFITPESLNRDCHVNYVRMVSVLYGLIALIIIFLVLQRVVENPFNKLLILLFLLTTPKFVFVFSTYNNDSLATLLGISMIALSYSLFQSFDKWKAVLLVAVTTAGLYTKYTMVFCIATIVGVVLVKNIKNLKEPNIKKLLILFFLSILLFIPYLVLHNLHYSGMFFPSNTDSAIKCLSIGELSRGLKLIIAPFSLVTTNQWLDPWAFGAHTKQWDFWAFVFVTSVLGEYIFFTPSPNIAFYLLWINLAINIIAIKEIFRSDFTKLVGLAIFFCYLSLIAFTFHAPVGGCTMDFRYIAWSWILWSILYASAVSQENSILSKILNKLLIVGIIINVYFLLTCSN